jgi:hypothetical protein
MNEWTKNQKFGWIEEYSGCSCSSVEKRKKDLLGYCKYHGGDHKNRSRFPIDKDTQFTIKTKTHENLKHIITPFSDHIKVVVRIDGKCFDFTISQAGDADSIYIEVGEEVDENN